MSYSGESRTWDPRLGIRFSPRPQANPLYPQLDLARYLQSPSLSGPTNTRSTGNSEPEDIGQQDGFETEVAVEPLQHSLSLPAAVEPKTEPAPIVSEEGMSTADDVNTSDAVAAVPPMTSLEYNISSDAFYAARNSSMGSLASYWSHTMYRRTTEDGTVQKVKVHYCTSKHSTEHICKTHFLGEKVLGFDLEWYPYATRGSGPRDLVSVIQLASPGRVGIFHVAVFPKDDFVAPSFKQIMEDAGVSKVGVNIKGDCARLRNYLGIDARGVFELSHLYKLVKHSYDGRTELINKRVVALASQAEEYFHLPLYKGDSVRSSNWRLPLTETQINYSASDAYAGLQLYYLLEARRERLEPVPPRPYHAELNLPIRIAESPSDDAEVEEVNEVVEEIDEAELTILSETRLPAASTPNPSNISPKPTPKERDTRLIAAELKIKEFRSTAQKTIRASPSSLRAYYIWQANAELNPEAIAKLLRDPPLKTNTVITYILDAIAAEGLPYSKPRLSQEVLSLLQPQTTQLPRYQRIVLECQRQ